MWRAVRVLLSKRLRRRSTYSTLIDDDGLVKRHIVEGKTPMVRDAYVPVATVVAQLVRCGWDLAATARRLPDLTTHQIRAARHYAYQNPHDGVFSITRRRWRSQLASIAFSRSSDLFGSN